MHAAPQDEGQKRPPKIGKAQFKVDRKFDTALRSSTLDALEDELERYEQGILDLHDASLDANMIVQYHPNNWRDLRKDTTFLPRIQWELLYGIVGTGKFETNKRVADITRTVVMTELRWYLSTYLEQDQKPEAFRKIGTRLEEGWPRSLVNCVNFSMEMMNTIERMIPIHEYIPTPDGWTDDALSTKFSQHSFSSPGVDSLSFKWGYTYCLLYFQSEVWLLPRVTIQELSNKTCDLMSVLYYAFITAGISYPSNIYHIVTGFLGKYIRAHITCPDKFFDFAGALEGICLGLHLLKTEEWKNDHLINNIVTDLRSSFKSDWIHFSPIMEYLTLRTPLELAAIGCLVKLTGHPLIDVASSAERVLQRATEDIPIDTKAVGELINLIVKQYVKSHIRMKRRWPVCEVDHHAPIRLIEAHRRNEDPDSSHWAKLGPLPLEAWAHVEIGKNDEYEFFGSLIPYLDDKAISLLRPSVIESYLEGNKLPITNRVDTRLLLSFLMTENASTDFIRYNKLFDQCTSRNDYELIADYLVIRLVPKEKENKRTKARLFGVKTLMDRFRGMQDEVNVLRVLRDYCPSQALQITELQLTKKIHALTRLKHAFPDHAVFMVSMDASGWCGKFRDTIVSAVMKHTIDKIFGIERLQYLQKIYENTMFYVPDYPSTHAWLGQYGGTEGLNQGSWTYVYSAEISHSLMSVPGEQKSLIKGDDTRVFLIVPKAAIPGLNVDPDAKLKFALDLMKRIQKGAAKFGHELKVTESYPSEITFAFSKIIHYKDIMMPADFRKIQKTYGATNALFPFLDDYIGCSFANAHSTCFYSTSPLCCYTMAVMWGSLYLVNSDVFGDLPMKNLCALLVTPSVVGGFPIIQLHHMMVRAESDHLTSFIDLLLYIEASDPDLFKCCQQFLCQPVVRDPNFLQLLSDPYSIPWAKPPSAKMHMRKFMRKTLPKTTKSNELRDLFNENHMLQLKQLITTLKSANEWNAKIFHGYYKLTIDNVINELVTQFLTATTIVDYVLTVRKRQSDVIVKTFVKIDEKALKHRRQTVTGCLPRSQWLHNPCSYECAYDLRNTVWSRVVSTVTQPCVIHQVRIGKPMTLLQAGREAFDSHFTLTKLPSEKNPELRTEDPLYRSSIYDPKHAVFLGASTSQGTSDAKIKLTFANKITLRVADALMLASWTSKIDNDGNVSNSPELVERLLSSYVSGGVQRFAPFMRPRKTGTIQHRYPGSGFENTIVPNCLINCQNLFSVEANTHGLTSNSNQNYRINFFEIQSQSMLVLTTLMNLGVTIKDKDKYWIQTKGCPCTSQSFVEPAIVFDTIAVPKVRPVLKHLALSKQANEILERELAAFYEIVDPFVIEPLDGSDADQYHQGSQILARHLFITKNKSTGDIQNQNPTMQGLSMAQMEVLASIDLTAAHDKISQNAWRAISPEDWCAAIFPEMLIWMMAHTTSADSFGLKQKFTKVNYDRVPWVDFARDIINFQMHDGFLEYLQDTYPDVHVVKSAISGPPGFAHHLGLCAIKYMGRKWVDEHKVYFLDHEVKGLQYNRFKALYGTYMWKRIKTTSVVTLRTGFQCEDEDMLTLVNAEGVIRALLVIAFEATTECISYDDFEPMIHAMETTPNYKIYLRDEMTRVVDLQDIRNIYFGQGAVNRLNDTEVDNDLRNVYRGRLHRIFRRYREEFEHFILNEENDELIVDLMLDVGLLGDGPSAVVNYQTRADLYIMIKESGNNFYQMRPRLLYPAPDEPLPTLRSAKPVYGIMSHRDVGYDDNLHYLMTTLPIIQQMPRRAQDCESLDSSLLRPIGHQVLASSKFITMFSDLGFLKFNETNNLHGWFLGDGWGGITRCFLSLNRNNTVVFNTKIADEREGAQAHIVHLGGASFGERVDYTSQRLRIHDLSTPEIILAFKSMYLKSPDFIHCDADVFDYDEALRVMSNVITICRGGVHDETVCVVKIPKVLTHEAYRVIDMIDYSFCQWALYDPYSNYCGGPIYVVFQKPCEMTNISRYRPRSRCSVKFNLTYTNFADRHNNYWSMPSRQRADYITNHKLPQKLWKEIRDYPLQFRLGYGLSTKIGVPVSIQNHRQPCHDLAETLELIIVRYVGWIKMESPPMTKEDYVMKPYMTVIIKILIVKRLFFAGAKKNFELNLKQVKYWLLKDVKEFLVQHFADNGSLHSIKNKREFEEGFYIVIQSRSRKQWEIDRSHKIYRPKPKTHRAFYGNINKMIQDMLELKFSDYGRSYTEVDRSMNLFPNG